MPRETKKLSPFVLSIDGEVLVVLENLSYLLSAKMDEPILHVRGWINVQVAIAVAR